MRVELGSRTMRAIRRRPQTLLPCCIAGKRLGKRRLTVIDATNVQVDDRKKLISLAREHHALPVAVVFDLPERVCQERTKQRDDRSMGRHVINQQRRALKKSLRNLRREGFRHTFVLRTPDEVDEVAVERARLWTD